MEQTMNTEKSESDVYFQWVEMLVEINSIKDLLRNKTLASEKFKQTIIKNDIEGCIGLEFTDHSIKKITESLERLAGESSDVSREYFSTDIYRSLSRLSNAQNFVLTAMARAYSDGRVVKRPSQSSSGNEYHYNSRIESWRNDDKVIEMVSVVESNRIKTIFFNWVKS
jgi:hypothetical protein